MIGFFLFIFKLSVTLENIAVNLLKVFDNLVWALLGITFLLKEEMNTLPQVTESTGKL